MARRQICVNKHTFTIREAKYVMVKGHPVNLCPVCLVGPDRYTNLDSYKPPYKSEKYEEEKGL